MPLFSSMYTGVSGLKTSQIGINTTAHNLANVYTEGYVRQQISYADANYTTVGRSQLGNWKVGLGVVASETRHIRAILLDKAYREQVGRENYYSSQHEATEEVENILGELNSVAFQDSLNDLWEALSEMAKTPDSSVSREGLVMSTDEFLTRVNAIGNQLREYQSNLNKEVTDTVAQINALADKIYSLNVTIQGIEAAGTESANDYRDQRDLAIDQLAELINISYIEDEKGFVTIRAEGQDFITYGGVFYMGVDTLNTADDSNYYTPVWPHLDNAPVFNLATEISSSKGNDIGKLKGLLQARGDYVADYTDIPKVPEMPKEEDYTDAAGNLDTAAYEAAIREYWDVTYQDYLKEAQEYNLTVGASVILKSQAMFDQLINSIVTMINDTLCPNKDTTISGGTTLTIEAGTNYAMLADEIKNQLGGVNLDDNGCLVNDETFTLTGDITVSALDTETCGNGYDGELGVELISRDDTQSRYTELTAADGTVYYVYNPYNTYGTEGKYSVGNIKVNQTVLDKTSSLPLWDSEGGANYQVAESIIKKWDEASVNLDPNNLTEKDFNDYYTAMVDVIANDGYVFNSITTNQQTVVNDIQSSRESVTGVSSEEELTNLIKFQNAYNANSRFINVIAEMIDTLINRVGVH
ncbi:MAG: flagellar hook-associated protein FlgK [Lachnospiraceae bacterium]